MQWRFPVVGGIHCKTATVHTVHFQCMHQVSHKFENLLDSPIRRWKHFVDTMSLQFSIGSALVMCYEISGNKLKMLVSILRVIHKRLAGIPTRCVIRARYCWLKIRLCLLWNFMQSRRRGITLRFLDNGCMSAIYDFYNIISLNSISMICDDDNQDANSI